MSTKDQFNYYREIQDDYLQDIDLNGGMLLEFEKLNIGTGFKNKT